MILPPPWPEFLRTRGADLRARLIKSFDDSVDKVMRATFSGRLHGGSQHAVSREGLESAGWIGLIRGVDTYRPDRGASPKTHIENYIRYALLDELRAMDPLTRNDRLRVKAGALEPPPITVPVPLDGDMAAARAEEVGPEATAVAKEGLRRVLGRLSRAEAAYLIYTMLEGLPRRQAVRLAFPRRRYSNVPRKIRKILKVCTFPSE